MTQQDDAGAKPPFERYALYWTPAHDLPLAEFGRAWLGYDPDTGNPVARRDDRGLGFDLLDRITQVPRRYGFHGTLLAPYQLRDGMLASELSDRLKRFAGKREPVDVGPLKLARLTDFLALVPQTDVFALRALHTECAFAFDRFRAPLSDAEWARRSAPELSQPQGLMLAQWGYPYMLSDFRFHLTLTGPLDQAELSAVMDKLVANLEDICASPLILRSVSLCGDPGLGRPFRVLSRFPFKG